MNVIVSILGSSLVLILRFSVEVFEKNRNNLRFKNRTLIELGHPSSKRQIREVSLIETIWKEKKHLLVRVNEPNKPPHTLALYSRAPLSVTGSTQVRKKSVCHLNEILNISLKIAF